MSTTDLPGSSLLAGRYRLVERLGAGGMSVVWRGFDEVLGRQVAVKVLPPSTSTDPSFRRRLRAEAKAAARLSHPHITNVYDYGEAVTVDGEPVPYVVMELVDGESLAAVLARSRRLPWPAAVRISAEVSAALAAAHARGIVHRDVTPANVMLTPSGAKVVDFGISALIGENDIDPDGSLLGTPAYLAPERLEGGQVSPATDVYAVGLLIYRTLIGQLPWDVGTTTALLRAHQYTEPEPLPRVEGLPSAVAALIARCLEKRPDDRPSSAEVAHVLAGVAAEIPGGRGFVPDWADSSEDTTILPSARSVTGGLSAALAGQARAGQALAGQGRAGQARVEAQPDRGVAAVRGGVAAPARVSDAPVSPAPGSAMPVPISDVEAAVDGQPIRGAAMPAGPATAYPAGPPRAAPAGSGQRGAQPGPSGGRNSRFAGARPVAAAGSAGLPSQAPPVSPQSTPSPRQGPHGASPAPAVPRQAAHVPSQAAPRSGGPALRPAFGDAPAGPPRQAGGAGTPPGRTPPGPGRSGGSGPGRRTGGNQTRRVLFVAGAVVVLGAGAYAWSLSSANVKSGNTATPEPSVVALNGKCVVSYAVWSQEKDRFKASVSVANRGTAPIQSWKLWFPMPGDQVMSGGTGKEKLDQQNGAVTVSSKDVLKPQGTRTMQITGRYRESNAPPMAFQLDGQDCKTYVSAKPGAKSLPVEHLSNGQNRFGPAPTSALPLPGLSTKPNGVVVPIPVVPTTNPTLAASPGTSTGPLAGSDSPAPAESASSDDAPPPSPQSHAPDPSAPTSSPPSSGPPPGGLPVLTDPSDDGT